LRRSAYSVAAPGRENAVVDGRSRAVSTSTAVIVAAVLSVAACGTPPTPSSATAAPSARLTPPPVIVGANVAIVVREEANDNGLTSLLVTELRMDGSQRVVTAIPAASIPDAATIGYDTPYRVSNNGLLAIAINTPVGDQERADVLVYTLSLPGDTPTRIETVTQFAWTPDARLAYATAEGYAVTDLDTNATRTTTIAAGIDVHTGRLGALTLLADGSGVVARRTVAGQLVTGVVGLDGTFTVGGIPSTFAPTGLERPYDSTGRMLGIGCDQSGGPEPGGCVLSAMDGADKMTVFYTDKSGEGTFRDYTWSADGTNALLILDRQRPQNAHEIRVVRTRADKKLDVLATFATQEEEIRFAGFTPDDRFVVLELSQDTVVIDTATGATARTAGRFAGWADSRGFTYPRASG
jgi:hypothetical protein